MNEKNNNYENPMDEYEVDYAVPDPNVRIDGLSLHEISDDELDDIAGGFLSDEELHEQYLHYKSCCTGLMREDKWTECKKIQRDRGFSIYEGGHVSVEGSLYQTSYGENYARKIRETYAVQRYIPRRVCPVLLKSNIGWIDATGITGAW